MKHKQNKYTRVLSLAPSTDCLGFAVLENRNELVDWGIKLFGANMDKNARSLVLAEKMIAFFRPDILVLENYSAKGSRRSPRIRDLGEQLVAMAARHKIKTAKFSRDEVQRTFFPDGSGTKYAVGETLADRFPGELGTRLPPKRKPWMSPDRRMQLFDAVALALTFHRKRQSHR